VGAEGRNGAEGRDGAGGGGRAIKREEAGGGGVVGGSGHVESPKVRGKVRSTERRTKERRG
jgi:hypothetical protein